MAKYISEC